MKSLKNKALSLPSVFAALPLLAADSIDLNPKGQFVNLGNITIASLVSALIGLTLIVAALVFFFMLVIGGIRWILSGGDKAQTEAARSQITAALVGLVVIFAAWAIMQLANSIFGIDILGGLTIPCALTGGTGCP